VTEVLPNTPAADAGVEELDVIVGFDGVAVDGPRSLQEVVERSDMNKQHQIVVLREGKKMNLSISVKPLPNKLSQRSGGRKLEQARGEETFYSEEFGLEVRDKDSLPEKNEMYEGFEGVVVDRVDPDGIAAAAGIGPGVLIRKVGKEAVTTIGEFAEAIEKQSAEDGVMLQVRTPRGNAVILMKKSG